MPEMHASFLIHGPSIKANHKIGMVTPCLHLVPRLMHWTNHFDQVESIDIGPTVAYIMGLDFPDVEGRVLFEVFK